MNYLKYFITLLCIGLFSANLQANETHDIRITIANPSKGVKVTLASTYLATSDDADCTERVRDGWSSKIVRIRRHDIPARQNGAELTAPFIVNGKSLKQSPNCDFERVNSSLRVATEDVKKSYNEVSVFDDGEGQGLQTMSCAVQNIRGHGEMVECYGDISLDEDGKATVEVDLQ